MTVGKYLNTAKATQELADSVDPILVDVLNEYTEFVAEVGGRLGEIMKRTQSMPDGPVKHCQMQVLMALGQVLDGSVMEVQAATAKAALQLVVMRKMGKHLLVVPKGALQ